MELIQLPKGSKELIIELSEKLKNEVLDFMEKNDAHPAVSYIAVDTLRNILADSLMKSIKPKNQELPAMPSFQAGEA